MLPVAFLFLFASGAMADEYSALMKEKKYAEASAAANVALAKDPANASALVVKSRLIMLQTPDSGIDEAVALAEKCVAAHPKTSVCHDALGQALGTKAMMRGILASIGSAPTIRESFKTAVELDPQNMSARFDLLQYYMQAPSIVGGGSDKARLLAIDTAKAHSEGGKLMTALIDFIEDRAAQAESAALKVQPGSNDDLANTQRDVLLGLSWKYMKAGKFDDAIRLFKEVQKRFPMAEGAPFGVGVVMQTQGKHQDALAALEQANTVFPSAEFDYHMGISWQAMHDTPKALALFEKALSAKPALKKPKRQDAEKRLKELKA